jgi:hypothetical protein
LKEGWPQHNDNQGIENHLAAGVVDWSIRSWRQHNESQGIENLVAAGVVDWFIRSFLFFFITFLNSFLNIRVPGIFSQLTFPSF